MYRAASRKAELLLPVVRGRVRLVFLVAARPEHTKTPLHTKVTAENESGFCFALSVNPWTTRWGELDLESERITVTTENPWSPDRVYDNGDLRALGILLSAIRIIQLEKKSNFG